MSLLHQKPIKVKIFLVSVRVNSKSAFDSRRLKTKTRTIAKTR